MASLKDPPAHWLLLRGLSREQRHWGGFPEALSKKLGAQVHCLDFPGTGTEHARQSPASVRAIADDLRGRWLPGRAAGPWGLFAMSLGGMVAMDWCAAHPADFSALVLVNSSARNLSPPWRRMRLRVVPQIALALAARDRVKREHRILRMTTRLHRDLPALSREWARIGEESPVTRATVLRQLAAAARFRAPLAVRPRALVVSGGQDPFTDPACQHRLAQHFGAPLAVHPEAGHDLSTDDPEWLAEQVRAWLA